MTDSNTNKKRWYWPDTDTDIRNWCSPKHFKIRKLGNLQHDVYVF